MASKVENHSWTNTSIKLEPGAERVAPLCWAALEKLQMGDRVRVQNTTTLRWDEVSTVIRSGRNWDYIIEVPNGRTKWRNRTFLIPTVEIDPDVAREEDNGVPVPGEEDSDFKPRRGTRDGRKTV